MLPFGGRDRRRGPGPGPGHLHFDGVPPVPELFYIPSVAGPAGKVALFSAVALPGVVDLTAFILVVADGIPSGLAVTGDDALQVPLPAAVEVPNNNSQRGEHCH